MAVALFSYRKGNSLLHRIPALVKIGMLIFFSAFVFLGGTSHSLDSVFQLSFVIKTALSFSVAAVLFFLSGARCNSVFQLKSIFILCLIITAFRAICIPSENSSVQNDAVIAVLPFLGINLNGLAAGIAYSIQLILVSFAAQLLFETTSSLQIKNSLEAVQDAAAKIIPPVKKLNLALILSLAINFMPEVFETWRKVNLASRARMNSSKKRQPVKITVIAQEFIALFSCLLIKAETTRKALLNRS